MSLSIEEVYVKNIENGIRAIKLGTKKPEDIKVWVYLEKLRNVNDGLTDDLTESYKKAIEIYKNNQEKLVNNKNNVYLYKNK